MKRFLELASSINAVFATVSLLRGDVADAAAMIGFAIFFLMHADRA